MQDFLQKGDGNAQDPATLKVLQEQAKARGEVMPFEKVTVYATDLIAKHSSIPEITRAGHPMEVHPALAEKLIDQGKATKNKPAGAPSKDEELIKQIEEATTVQMVDSYLTDDSSDKVKKAAEKKKKELNK